MGAVADEPGNLLNQYGTGVGHSGLSATQVTPVTPTAVGELLLDVTLALANGQITAHGIEEPPDNAGTIAITGGIGRYQSAGGRDPLPRRRPGRDPPASNYRTVTGRHHASWPLPVIDSRLGCV